MYNSKLSNKTVKEKLGWYFNRLRAMSPEEIVAHLESEKKFDNFLNRFYETDDLLGRWKIQKQMAKILLQVCWQLCH